MIAQAFAAPEPAPTSADVAIDLVAQQIDAVFLNAGTALASAYELVEGLIANLAQAAAALDGDSAGRAIANLQNLAGHIGQVPETVAARAAALADIAAASAQVNEQVFGVRRTIEFLRICGLNIKVASGGLHGFSDFADQMLARLDLSDEEISGIRREAQQLLVIVPSVVAVDRKLAAECSAISADVPRNLEANALALQGYMQAAETRSSQVAAIACRLRAQLAEALGAIQIGDITRQRLEHVAAGFRILVAEHGIEHSNDPARAAVAAHVLALLQALNTAAIEDFERESRRLFDGQRLIACDIAEVLALRGEGGQSGTSGDLLRALETEVAGIGALTQNLRDADRRSHALGRETIATVEDLSRRLALIHRVTAEVDNMAWNADIRCYRMGDQGRGLAQVAHEIRSLVGTLEAICVRVDAAVVAVNAAATRIASEASPSDGDGQTLEQSLAIIRDGARRANESLDQLDSRATSAADVVGTAAEAIAAIEGLCAPLATAAAELSQVAGSLPGGPGELHEGSGALLHRIFGLFTMESERQIHRRFSLQDEKGGGSLAPELTDGKDEDEDEDDGLF